MSDDRNSPAEPEYPHTFTVSPLPEREDEVFPMQALPSDDTVSPPEARILPNKPEDPPPHASEKKKPYRPPHPPVRPPATPPLCHLSGQVINRFSLPVRDAEVSLIPHGSSRAVHTVKSDALGRFRISHVRPGRYHLKAKRRFRRAEQEINISPKKCNQTGIRIRL